jgi:hypothetical protein
VTIRKRLWRVPAHHRPGIRPVTRTRAGASRQIGSRDEIIVDAPQRPRSICARRESTLVGRANRMGDMAYFSLDRHIDEESALQLADIDVIPATEVPWTVGVSWSTSISEPIPFELDPHAGTVLPDAFLVGIPLFSDRLLDLLHACGVDNLEQHSATVRDLRTGVTHTHYSAVNIVGSVACADLEKSAYHPDFGPPRMLFHELVIDEQRAGGQRFFRLAELNDIILVHEKVAQRLIAADCLGFQLLPVSSA